MLLTNLFLGLHRGETFARILMNTALENTTVAGNILDLGAASEKPSYFDHLHLKDGSTVASLDIDPAKNPTIVANVEERLPIPADRFDVVLCMNLLEHIWDFNHVVRESHRILRNGGRLIGVTPFLYPIHPFPQGNFHDVFRFTDTALLSMLKGAGYRNVTVKPLGFGPASTALFFLEHPFVSRLRWIPLLRFLLYLLTLTFDVVVYSSFLRLRHGVQGTPFVLMYLFEGSK